MQKLAILCDIDGTLAIRTTRGPYDFARCREDTPYRAVIVVLHALSLTHEIILVTGREDCWREDTLWWLIKHNVPEHSHLYMRATGDMRSDEIVKKAIYEEHIRPQFDITCVFDDRNRVVEMWRSLGLACFQVAPGDF